mmetsp:Transcript_9921/g.23271  ORF Transcript_9921/g.23271 Transcript_9921/m.23271 type:complete len:402 (-) Transcript_9921:935-2140(-)
MLPGLDVEREIGVARRNADQADQRADRKQAQRRGHPGGQQTGQQRQAQAQPDAGSGGLAEPGPGVVGPKSHRGRGGRADQPEQHRTARQSEPAQPGTCDADHQQHRRQQAERDGQGLQPWRQFMFDTDRVTPLQRPGRAVERFQEGFAPPGKPLAQAERQRRRIEQGHRPEREQGQGGCAAGAEPLVPNVLPPLQPPQPVQHQAEQDTQHAAEGVEAQIRQRRDAPRQEELQRFHHEGQQRPRQQAQHQRGAQVPSRTYGRRKAKQAERDVAEQVGLHVERPEARRPVQSEQPGQTHAGWPAPGPERVQAGVDDQPDMGQQQPGGGALTAAHGPSRSERLDRHQHDDGGKQQHCRLVVDPKPAVAASVGEGLEAAQQAPVHVMQADRAGNQQQLCMQPVAA